MEENNDIFIAGGNALVYLTESMHKKAFVWGHSLSTYLPYDQSFNLLFLFTPVHILIDPPPFP